jgi:hypothetical protein
MKCDDDTYVRVDALLNELKMVNRDKDLYMGNMNMLHRPLRTGKWAVTFEVSLVVTPKHSNKVNKFLIFA